MRKQPLVFLLAGCAGIALSAGQAQAQDAAAPTSATPPQDTSPAANAPEDDSDTLGDIVVTARKRAETIISTPTAITAITGPALSARGITDYQTLSDFTPSMKSGKQSSNRNDRYNQVLVVRGMQPGADAPSRQAAAVFIDGSPVGNGSVAGLTDIERVEVVAGPQSAYYGRSTFSGAVNIITRPPGDEFRASLDASYSSFATTELKAAIEGPIVKDLLSVRVSGRYFSTNGQYDNYGYPGKLGAQKTRSGTVAIYFTPTPTTRIRIQGSIWTDDDGAPAAGQLYAADYNCRTKAAPTAANNYICGPISKVPGNRMTQQTLIPSDIIDLLLNSATVVDTDSLSNIGLLRHAREIHGSLSQDLGGGYTFDVNGSMVDNKLSFLTDTGLRDGRNQPNPSFGVIPGVLPYFSRTSVGQSFFRGESVEARVSSPADKPISWLIGTNAFRQRETRITNAFSNSGFARPVPLITEGSNTVGFFGALNWRIVKPLTFSLETRYQIDRIMQETPTANIFLKQTFRSFTPRAILTYQPSSDINIYASYAEGTRPGEFNSSLYSLPTSAQVQVQAQLAVPIAVPEEKVKMAEIGFKANLFDHRLRLLTAFYVGRWSGRHVTQRFTYLNPTPQPVSVVIGGSDVDLRGVELEASLRVSSSLTLEGTFDYAGTDIRKTVDLVSLQLLGNQNPVGNALPRYPITSGSLSADYHRTIAGDLRGFARIDYLFTGRQYDSEANLAWTPNANRVNARIGIEKDNYRVELFGLNIFDNRVPTNITRSTDTYTAANTIALSPPMPATIGVRISIKQ